jgi:NAD(P)H-dependent FMN reductase
MSERRRFVLISGSLRAGSVSSAVIATAAASAPAEVEACKYRRMGELPQ